MSEISDLMAKLDAVETNLNTFTQSHAAQVEANKTGLDAMTAQLQEMRTQNQEFAELARRGIPKGEREIYAALGALVIKSVREPVVKAASEGTDTAGGYLVEDDVRHNILSVQQQYGLVRQLFGANIYPMSSDVMTVPVDTYEETSGNTPEPAATSENAAITESDDAVLAQVSLTAQKYATLNYVSQELIDDAFVAFIGAYLTPKLARRASRIEDVVVFAAATTGLLNSSNVLSIVMDGGDIDFQNINFDYLVDLEGEVVDDALSGDARYIAHRTIINLLRKLKGNDGQYIWTPAAAAEPATINGYPYSRCSVAPAKSASAVSTGFALFGDVTQGCVVGERLERRINTSEHFRFNYDQIAVRMTFRFALGTNANIGRALCRLVTAAE